MTNKIHPDETFTHVPIKKYLLMCRVTSNLSTFSTYETDINILIDNFRKIWYLDRKLDVLVFDISNAEIHINVSI